MMLSKIVLVDGSWGSDHIGAIFNDFAPLPKIHAKNKFYAKCWHVTQARTTDLSSYFAIGVYLIGKCLVAVEIG